MRALAALILSFLILPNAFARPTFSEPSGSSYITIGAPNFEPNSWSEGIHLFAGAGINSSSYFSAEENIDAGLGLNLKTDLLYVLNPRWALEWGANVSFHRVEGVLIWDTPITVGVRFQVPKLFDMNGAPYVRAFAGASPTIVFINGNEKKIEEFSLYSSSNNDEGRIDRLHFNGPVVGLAAGTLRKTESGLVWYSEFTVTGKWIEQEERIQVDGEVPVVVSSSKQDRTSGIFSIYWSIGILAF